MVRKIRKDCYWHGEEEFVEIPDFCGFYDFSMKKCPDKCDMLTLFDKKKKQWIKVNNSE